MEALGVKGKLYGFGVDSWTNHRRTYEDNIKSIENGNTGFLVKTGDESYNVVADFDMKETTHTESKELLDLCLKRDTSMIRTPSGGYHFYFKYTRKLPTNKRGIYGNIDIRSNKGCVFFGYREDGAYTISDKSKPIKAITFKILAYIFRYKKVDIKPFEEIKEVLDQAESENKNIVNIHNLETVEKYNISDSDFKKLLFSLPTDYVDDYNKWLTIRMLCKNMDSFKYGMNGA